MHDYFEILGVQPGAPAAVIRRASLRRGALHPDFRPPETRAARGGVTGQALARDHVPQDAAVDFIEMNDLVDSMEVAFFRSRG